MTLATEPVLPEQPLPTSLHRLTVDQYHQMIEAEVLKSGDPIELLEGLLVDKMTKNVPHRAATRRIRTQLEAVVTQGWYVDAQEPITTLDSEPEPDVTVIRGQPDDYYEAMRHPYPSDLALVVEVADSSLRQDQTLKKRIYARASIPVYWIANLVQMQLEVYTDPQSALESPDYATLTVYTPGQQVPFALEGVTHLLNVDDLLP